MRQLLYVFAFLVTLTRATSCTLEEKIPLQDWNNLCGNENIWIIDSLQEFLVPSTSARLSLPISWHTVFDSTDLTLGYTSIDTSQNYLRGVALTILENEFYSLKEYFKNDLELIQNDHEYKLIDFGQFSIHDKNSFWILNENNFEDIDMISLIRYFEIEDENRILLLNFFIKKSKNWKSQLCELSSLVNYVGM